ncbi:Glycosyltransferase involved in cell wall bisynthesis [Paenibacillus sp. yr247]|uniref:glycosyltransferase n=1 Tax=Paenibacillus sp. yr247 TaxID=1761880 RepID=UPI000886F52D|nr:glycosyltransferase [Paenibacillus sp. yr247]SDO85335.1 Glycosyltransferase involved in cell wall bisynthesis [Paenibacillus sp. yr247]
MIRVGKKTTASAAKRSVLAKNQIARKANKKKVGRKINRSDYNKGYNVGFDQAYNDGFNAGYSQVVEQYSQVEQGNQINSMEPNTLLTPIALVIPASMELPSLKMMIYHPFEQMKKLGQYNFQVRTEDSVSREDIASADIVVFVRNVEPDAYRYLEVAHEMGKRTVYCIDDNFLEIPQGALAQYYQEPVRKEAFINFLRNAQIIHVNSDYFADYIRLHFNSRVANFPATVDFEWLDQAVEPARQDGQIVIGYAGTYKENDFKPIIPAIKRLLNQYGSRIRVEFFGFIPSSLQGYPGVTHLSYEGDYRSFIHKLYQVTWDIGLAPLADTLFNYCKTNNKFREYGACMIPGIYSEAPAYKGSVNHRETGYIVPHNEEGWYNGIKQMIENPDLRQKIKGQAEDYARRHFSIDSCVMNWRNMILN